MNITNILLQSTLAEKTVKETIPLIIKVLKKQGIKAKLHIIHDSIVIDLKEESMIWYTIQEKKPKENRRVLVLLENGNIQDAIANKDWQYGFKTFEGFQREGKCVGPVKYWAEFPELPDEFLLMPMKEKK